MLHAGGFIWSRLLAQLTGPLMCWQTNAFPLGLIIGEPQAWGLGRKVWYVAPTYRQAQRVAWKPLKQMTKPYWVGKPNETDLTIELISGGAISLRGADNYDSLRGDGLDFIVITGTLSTSQRGRILVGSAPCDRLRATGYDKRLENTCGGVSIRRR